MSFIPEFKAMKSNENSSKSLDEMEQIQEFKTINFASFLKSFENIIAKSLPSILVMEMSKFSSMANLYFVSGNQDLIGVGFGTIWIDLTVRHLLVNLNLSIGQVMNKHFREGHFQKMGICYQRALILAAIYFIFITPFLRFQAWFLNRIGVDSQIYTPACQYAWDVVPALYAEIYYDATKNYLHAMDVYYPLIVIQFFSAILHVIVAQRLIVAYDLHLKGAAWAKNFTNIFMALLLYIYIAKYHSKHPSWCEWDKRALKNLLRFTKPILKITFKLFLQSSIFEAMVLVAMYFSYMRMTVMICFVFTAKAIFMVHLGMAQSVQATIYSLFRREAIQKAQRQSLYFLMSNILISFILSLLLHIFVKDWENIFGLDNEINAKLEELLDIFCLTVSLEGVHIIIASVLSAIGQQDFILNFSTITLYFLGIGSGIYLGHVKGRLLNGLWSGWIIGLSFSAFCLLIRLALVDWMKAAKDLIVVKNEKQ